jgi:hypothetical protein
MYFVLELSSSELHASLRRSMGSGPHPDLLACASAPDVSLDALIAGSDPYLGLDPVGL